MRSVLVVLAGVVFVIVVTTIVDQVMHSLRVYPEGSQVLDTRLSLIALSYRVVIGILGGWVTARFAPHNPMGHAMILGYVGTILGLVGVIGTWNLGLGPRWYPISLAVLEVARWPRNAVMIQQCWVQKFLDRA